MELKYHYVILGSEWDLYKISYSELDDIADANYIGGLPHLFGDRIGKIINSIAIRAKLPFLGYLIKRSLDNELKKTNKPICFIFFGNWVEYDLSFGIIDYLKSRYLNSKIVWFNQDLVKTHIRILEEIEIFKNKFDLILSFDYSDSNEYNMIYHPLVFTDVTNKYNAKIEYDVYFLGKAKNRLSDILKAYTYLKSKNLKLDFNLVGVPLDQRIFQDEINYIDTMSYDDNLRHVARSRCLLEVMQKAGTGYTLRVNEAICFGKKIITNNMMINDAPFYNSDYISVFDDQYVFDEDFLSKIHEDLEINYHYKEEISPLNFLKFIDERL